MRSKLGRALGRGRDPEPTDPVAVTSPVAGTVVALADVDDPVFSSGALGQGVGVRPSAGTVVAPVGGTVITAMPHAVGIEVAPGLQVLVHVGIDTVELEGRHFDGHVAQGQQVRPGDPVADVDLDGLVADGFDPTTLVVLTQVPAGATITAVAAPEVGTGDELLTITR